MIPSRALLLIRLLRSGWTIAAIAVAIAMLMEWGLIASDACAVR